MIKSQNCDRVTNLTNVRSGALRQRQQHTTYNTGPDMFHSLLSSDIEDDGAGHHLVCDDEEWRWRTIQDVCDVILAHDDTVPTPNLWRSNASLRFYCEGI